MVCKWKVSMIFGCWAMSLFSRSCHDLLNAKVPCCGSSELFFDVHDKSSYPWQFKRNSAMKQGQLLVGDPRRSYDVIMYYVIAGHENISVNNSSQKWGRAVGEVSSCLSCQDASIDMQYRLPWPFIRSGHLNRSTVRFLHWPFGAELHIVRCVPTTSGIRWCFAFFPIFLCLEAIWKKRLSSQKATFFIYLHCLCLLFQISIFVYFGFTCG